MWRLGVDKEMSLFGLGEASIRMKSMVSTGSEPAKEFGRYFREE